MPVIPDTPTSARYPVVRRSRIGETFIGAYIKHQQRDILKDGQPEMNAKTGKPRQELVVHALVMPGTTATVGNAEDNNVPAVGDIVRLILKGRSFSHWIDSTNALKGVKRAGDIIEQTIDQAQQYDANGAPTGKPLTTQDECDKVPRGRSLGYYGQLNVRAATATDMEWVAKADEAYATIGDGRTVDNDDTEPF